eukprot:SAG11_NODE_17129_length_527_cov_2.156542_1_plen_85_part_00
MYGSWKLRQRDLSRFDTDEVTALLSRTNPNHRRSAYVILVLVILSTNTGTTKHRGTHRLTLLIEPRLSIDCGDIGPRRNFVYQP